MCDTVTSLPLLLLLSCISANTGIKICADCVVHNSCAAAVVAFEKNDPIFDTLLTNSFCGFDRGQPKICCSELTTAAEAAAIDNHPNLPLLPEDCGVGDSYGIRISGGSLVPGLYEYPWMVLISYKTQTGPQFKCAGSLISERYVLTAAHCISKPQELLGVRLGEYDVDSTTDCLGEICKYNVQDAGGISSLYRNADTLCEEATSSSVTSNINQTFRDFYEKFACAGTPWTKSFDPEWYKKDIRIEDINTHPEYFVKFPQIANASPAVRNDIGLLRLKASVNLSSRNARTVCLPVTHELRSRSTDELNATVSHWPSTEKGYAFSKMQYKDVIIRTAQYCRDQYIKLGVVKFDEMLNKICCTYLKESSTCMVSGSPMMLWDLGGQDRLIQYGIASFGSRFCGLLPEIYTDVAKYMKWILDTIKP